MKNLIYLVLSGMFMLAIQGCNNNRKPSNRNYVHETRVDQDGFNFIKGGLGGGLTEIKASGLAITNSKNQRVIGFAKMMINDHTKIGDDLKKLATDKLVFQNDTIDVDHQQMISGLSKETGPAFDKVYMQMMVTDHEQAVKLFNHAVGNTDVRLSKFASQTLPTIQMHLDSAKAILSSLK